MFFSIFSLLYRVLTLLTLFSPPEVAPMTLLLLMHFENSLVDIYVWDLYVKDEIWMYGQILLCEDLCMDKLVYE
jgi:hypothetical protein